MIIHGVELDFHLHDKDKADMKERYFDALEKMKGVKGEMPEGTEQEQSKYLCDRIKGLFDTVFGEGTGIAVCGTDNDLLAHLEAYDQLVSEQIRQQNQYAAIMNRMKEMRKAVKK